MPLAPATNTDRMPLSAKEVTNVITRLEHETWRALSKTGGDMLPYLASDCTMLFPLGLKVTNTSEPSLRDILTSEAFIPWETYKLSDINVIILGKHSAAICYRVEATRPPLPGMEEDVVFKALITSVWRNDRDEGAWLLVVHQQTPVEGLDAME